MTESQELLSKMSRLVDHWLANADSEQRAAIVNVVGMMRHLSAYTAALTTELDHWAAAEHAALERAEELQCRVEELEAELVEARAGIDTIADALGVACRPRGDR